MKFRDEIGIVGQWKKGKLRKTFLCALPYVRNILSCNGGCVKGKTPEEHDEIQYVFPGTKRLKT